MQRQLDRVLQVSVWLLCELRWITDQKVVIMLMTRLRRCAV
jgi:hypothetical protein